MYLNCTYKTKQKQHLTLIKEIYCLKLWVSFPFCHVLSQQGLQARTATGAPSKKNKTMPLSKPQHVKILAYQAGQDDEEECSHSEEWSSL